MIYGIVICLWDKRTVGNLQPVVLLQAKTRGRTYAEKRDSALKCIQKKKLKQYLKDNSINSTIEDLTEEQLAEFSSNQNKKGPKYDMNIVKVVMPMKTGRMLI